MEFYRAYTYEDEGLEWMVYQDVLVMKFAKNIIDQGNFFKLLNESMYDILEQFKDSGKTDFLYIVANGRYNIDTSMENIVFKRDNEYFVGVEPTNFSSLVFSNLPREPIYRLKSQQFDKR